MEIKAKKVRLGEAFRADAKAEGQTVVVGGWECLGGTRPSAVRWFSVVLNRENAEWAFSKGEPFRVVAALELYATLVSVVVFADQWPKDSCGLISLVGTTDNGGNPHVLTRLMSSKFPLVVVLAELAEQLRSRGLSLDLRWAPRDQNEEADDLTNMEFGRFKASQRIVVDIKEMRWIVLGDLMEKAKDLYQEVLAIKSSRHEEGGFPRREKPGQRLRERDPWE